MVYSAIESVNREFPSFKKLVLNSRKNGGIYKLFDMWTCFFHKCTGHIYARFNFVLYWNLTNLYLLATEVGCMVTMKKGFFVLKALAIRRAPTSSLAAKGARAWDSLHLLVVCIPPPPSFALNLSPSARDQLYYSISINLKLEKKGYFFFNPISNILYPCIWTNANLHLSLASQNVFQKLECLLIENVDEMIGAWEGYQSFVKDFFFFSPWTEEMTIFFSSLFPGFERNPQAFQQKLHSQFSQFWANRRPHFTTTNIDYIVLLCYLAGWKIIQNLNRNIIPIFFRIGALAQAIIIVWLIFIMGGISGRIFNLGSSHIKYKYIEIGIAFISEY